MAIIQTVEEMEIDLGEKLKRLRLNKNLDQKTLAARAGVSVRALRNLEGGEGTTVRTLLSVVRALGRESWLQTVAPVPTINPATFTTRAVSRQRAASPRQVFKIHAAQRLLETANEGVKMKGPEGVKMKAPESMKVKAAVAKKKRVEGQDE